MSLKGAVSVKTRWKASGYTSPDTRQAVLVHPRLPWAVLPWWPEDIEQSDLARTYSEFARPGLAPLLIPEAQSLDSYNVSFGVIEADGKGSVRPLTDALRALAGSEVPVSLVLAKSSRGLFHITGLTITERSHTKRGNESWADVSMTLKRASDYTVKVGPVVKGSGKGFATKG